MKRIIITALIFTASTFGMEKERGPIQGVQEINVNELRQFLSQGSGLILASQSLHNSPNMKRNRDDKNISIVPCPVDNVAKDSGNKFNKKL